jgi:hypothetical protein
MNLNDITITLSKRKTIALHIHEDGNVELRAPYGVRRKVLADMVTEKSSWIKHKKAQCVERLSHLEANKLVWQDATEVPYYQRPLIVSYRFGKRRRSNVNGNILTITAVDNSAKTIKSCYFEWLRKQAKTVFIEKAEFWSQQLYPSCCEDIRIQPRIMSSRWGSCSKNKSLRLNLVLLMLPEALIDYVIVHELCHWQVFNHSRKFYQLLETVLPNWKSLEQQLRKHQYLLLEAKK